MSRAFRAAWRLLRCIAHGLYGLWLVRQRFPALDAAGRQAVIGAWSAQLLRFMGIALQVEGRAHVGATLLVANHVSWLDISALHAVVPQARFVSKAAVASWPLIGSLATSAGTLYLERERKRDAMRVVHMVGDALAAGGTVAVFPEGTTADGHALLPFHANLLQPAIATGAVVQPVALRFSDRQACISPIVEFVGATSLVTSLWRVASAEGLVCHVALLPPRASAGCDRRVLANLLRDDIAAHLARQVQEPQSQPQP